MYIAYVKEKVKKTKKEEEKLILDIHDQNTMCVFAFKSTHPTYFELKLSINIKLFNLFK